MARLNMRQDISIGKQIEPVKRVYLFSAGEYEEFIEEWLDTKKDRYFMIENNGGAGDMGRDVVIRLYHPFTKLKN